MGLFKFGHRAHKDSDSKLDADRARALSVGPLQTEAEQASVRATMEAELDAQRARRVQA